MDYQALAKDILESVGGKENINTAWHCATRLRFKLKDENKADTKKIEGLNGVVTVVRSAGQYQVVIGNSVAEVFDPLAKMADLENSDQQATSTSEDGKKESVVNRLISFISSIFTPFLGAMAGTGILKGILALLVAVNWLSTSSGTYRILYAAGDGFFYFLPIVLAFTAAKRLKVNQFVAVAMAMALVYPTLVSTASRGQTLHFLGIPVVPTTYTSSVIPILLAVWLLSYLEPFLNKIFPEAVRNVLSPLFSVLIMVPLTLMVVGPLGSGVGTVLSSAVLAVYNFMPALAGAIMGAFWEVFVIFGVHWAFAPVFINNIGRLGYDPLIPALSVAVISQAGAALGVFLKTKDIKMKSLSGSSFITAVMGITEPTVYGVTLKLRRPFIFAAISGGIGGAIAAAGRARAYSFTLPSLLALPTYIGRGFASVVIGLIVAFVLASVSTYFFGLTNQKQDAKVSGKSDTVAKGNERLLAPIDGTIIPLQNVKDEVFASEAMGKGIAIIPSDDLVKAPISGTISMLYPTGHAIGIISDSGIEVLIHIGIDTVQLKGRFFKTLVKKNEKVNSGQSLVSFDRKAIAAAGFDTTVMMIITNTANYDISATDETAANKQNWVLELSEKQTDDQQTNYKGEEVQHV